MKRLLNYFFRGLIFLAPLAVTLYVCYKTFVTIDGWLGLPIRGAGFAVTVVLVTLFGFLASTIIARSLFSTLDEVMDRLPFVRLLYASTRDLLNAFVGEQRRFDKPVLVTLYPGSQTRVLGFLTQESLAPLGLAGDVAVYVPQSYNFAGALVVVPAASVVPIQAESADVMAFILSGGVTAFGRRATPRAATHAVGP